MNLKEALQKSKETNASFWREDNRDIEVVVPSGVGFQRLLLTHAGLQDFFPTVEEREADDWFVDFEEELKVTFSHELYTMAGILYEEEKFGSGFGFDRDGVVRPMPLDREQVLKTTKALVDKHLKILSDAGVVKPDFENDELFAGIYKDLAADAEFLGLK